LYTSLSRFTKAVNVDIQLPMKWSAAPSTERSKCGLDGEFFTNFTYKEKTDFPLHVG